MLFHLKREFINGIISLMTPNERLTQLWSLLVDSAHAQRVLTYRILVHLIEVPEQAIGCLLLAIHDYCNFHNLPPLTMLVVNEFDDPQNRDLFDADIFGERARVFMFDWLSQKAPSENDFKKTTNNDANEVSWYGSWQAMPL